MSLINSCTSLFTHTQLDLHVAISQQRIHKQITTLIEENTLKNSRVKRGLAIATSIAALSTFATPAYAAAPTYMEAVASSATLTPIASAGDMIGSYLVPGIPDGLGVIKNGNTLRIITNHEWSATNAVAAGRTTAGGLVSGSFLSDMTYDIATQKVTKAVDLFKDVVWYDYTTGKYGNTPGAPAGAAVKDSYGTLNHSYLLNRFCSGSLSPAEAFYDKASGTGIKDALFFAGEEGSDESRGFATNLTTGQLVQLPALGLSAWENFIPARTTTKNTVIMGNEDGDAKDSQLWMYMGTKTKTGKWFEKAGLTNGKSYVLAATADAPVANDYEIRAKYGKNKPFAVTFAAVDIKANGKAQNVEANTKGIELARVEDGHFDPNKPNDFYFVTTQSDSDPTGLKVVGATTPNPATPTVTRDGGALWRLRFVDANKPFLGSTLELLLDGSEDIYMSKPDNITVDSLGNVLIQEDPGKNALLARIVSYRISDGKVGTIARFKADYFTESGTAFITSDEESSGIVEVSNELRTSKTDKASYFMFAAQIHATPAKSRPDMDATDATLAKAVEGGQWYILKITNWTDVYK
jgi:hypothetical protein